MSVIASVVSGEADESDTDEELSFNDAGGSGGPGKSDDASDAGGEGTTTVPRDELRPSRSPRTRPLRTLSAQPGVVVQGEASETDSDEENDSRKPKRSVSEPPRHVGLPPLKVELPSIKTDQAHLTKKMDQSPNGTLHPYRESPKYDTLLHRKLRERNASLQTDVYDAVANVFLSSARELTDANQMLTKSQSVIQDVCHNLRVFSTDLRQIEQQLDTISSCNNIPNISIDSSRGT